MGRARSATAAITGGTATGAPRTRRARSRTPAVEPTAAPLSCGFDMALFPAPGLDGSDLATVDVFKENERDSYYFDDGDPYNNYNNDPGSDYQVVTEVNLQGVGSGRTLRTVMLKHAADSPLIVELARNPYFFYAAGRAAQRFSAALGGVEVLWQAEHDYYAQYVSSMELNGYEHTLTQLKEELDSLYTLSVADENNRLIEEGLLREYVRLIPRVTNKSFTIKRIKIADIAEGHTALYVLTARQYINDQFDARRPRPRNMPVKEREFVKLALKQPQLVVTLNADGKYSIVDGHHRLHALKTTWHEPAPTHVYALVAE